MQTDEEEIIRQAEVHCHTIREAAQYGYDHGYQHGVQDGTQPRDNYNYN